MTDITLPREIAERGLQALEQMYKRAASVETQEASDQYLQNLADNPMSGEIALEAQEVLFIRGAIAALRERLAQPEMQPCAGRNCGSTNPNLHSAECFEDYEKATGMNQWQGLTDGEIDALAMDEDGLPNSHIELARAIEAKLREKNA